MPCDDCGEAGVPDQTYLCVFCDCWSHEYCTPPAYTEDGETCHPDCLTMHDEQRIQDEIRRRQEWEAQMDRTPYGC